DAGRARRSARAPGDRDRPLGARLAEIVVRRRRDEELRSTLEILLLPLPEPAADVLRVDLQGVADILEREEPGPILGRDPLARLVEDLLATRLPRVRVLLVAVDRVLEHGEHQEPLALETALAAECREELCREQHVRLEQPC